MQEKNGRRLRERYGRNFFKRYAGKLMLVVLVVNTHGST
jgi:hypothetical protein